jgi:hypothetical protein
MRSDFIVSSLSGTELLYFKSKVLPWTGTGFKFNREEELVYESNFMATGSKADVTQAIGNGFNIGKRFVELVVENNLIKGNSIDPEAEKRFIQLNNGTMPYNSNEANKTPAVVVNINNNNGVTSDNNSTPTTSIPKSSSAISITKNQIIRDSNIIGKFRQDTTSSSYSQKTVVITIYSAIGEKIAEASTPVANPQEWSIKILSENKTFNILYDSPNERENLFKWFADKRYLTN